MSARVRKQIENEYDMVQKAFKREGLKYVEWAGELAINSKANVPWIMCKQNRVPGAIVSYTYLILYFKHTHLLHFTSLPFFVCFLSVSDLRGNLCAD